MKKIFKKICCIATTTAIIFTSMISINAAPSSCTWNLYYTNSTSGNHTYESKTIADSVLYTCQITSLSGSNSGKKTTVSVLYAIPGRDTAVFTSASGTKTISSPIMNMDRTVTFTLSYTSNTGSCNSTGSISK